MYQCTRINQRKTPYSVCRVTPCSLLQASDHLLSRWECEDAELRQELHGLQGFMAPTKDGNRHGKKWGVMDQAPEDEGYEGWRFGSQFPFILFFFTNVKGCIPYLYMYIYIHTHIYIYIYTPKYTFRIKSLHISKKKRCISCLPQSSNVFSQVLWPQQLLSSVRAFGASRAIARAPGWPPCRVPWQLHCHSLRRDLAAGTSLWWIFSVGGRK